MRPVRGNRIVAILAAGGLTLAAAACGDAPDDSPAGSGSSAAAAYKACMVTDTGGIDDKSFNASAWAGLQAAKTQASNVDPKYVASSAEADYEPNLRTFVTQKCNFTLAVGGLMIDATKKIASENASAQFGIVDGVVAGQSNVYPMQFATDEAAFLAGYLAAGYSKSKKVATFGGMKLPTVAIFMDGFVDGVAYYNKQKNANVQVLGWDKAKQAGSFTDDFASPAKGKALANTLVAQGADVILPVAGGTGLGAAEVAQGSGGKVSIVWVDQDGCKSAAQYCDVFLTTVVKNITDAVEKAVVAGATGQPLAATPGYLGTLENNGVSLAPYNNFDSKIDATLKTEVDTLKADIVSGKVKVESTNAPK
ncbi:BMP family lipoprotein [Paractinoplanes deccanensis]|nr:BMP family ABC transporter substrate-binding protein [Actinoplanes deccanensis]